MQYAELAAFFEKLEGTTKRLEMTQILVDLLGALGDEEVEPTVYLLQGKVAPDWQGIELGLAEKTILKTVAAATGRADTTDLYHDHGDLGLAAEAALAGGSSKQATLIASEPLQVQEVFDRLHAIAASSGAGSQDKKQTLLHKLLLDASPLEARYIVRTVAGRLRLGVADMTVLDALAAWKMGKGVRSVQQMDEEERAAHEELRRRLERAYDVTSDLALVARTLVHDGLEAVERLDVRPGAPLRPMAAERLKSLGEILEKHGGRSALEYKYDGLRIQAHVPTKGPVRLFSRRLEDLTSQFPDVQAMLRDAFRGKEGVVEMECVAVGPDGRMRPFQELSRRRGRKTGLGEDARQETALAQGAATATTMMDTIPVAVFLFDCLAADGRSIMDEPYEARRARLDELFATGDTVRLAVMEVAEDEATMEAFFAAAVADGAEGIMCKALHAPYKAGNRGFDWIKFKTDYTADLVDTMDLVVIGAFFGRGRRAGWYGALLMAAYDEAHDRFASVCKLGTGFDDATLMGLKERFAPHQMEAKPREVESTMVPDVWLQPAIVMEVQAAELTLSPTHRAGWGQKKGGAGLAARFPRFSGRWRDDKSATQATTVAELLRMYEQQGSHQGSDQGSGQGT